MTRIGATIVAVAATLVGNVFAEQKSSPANGDLFWKKLEARVDEIAQLDNDPNYPEHGKLEIQVRGGR